MHPPTSPFGSGVNRARRKCSRHRFGDAGSRCDFGLWELTFLENDQERFANTSSLFRPKGHFAPTYLGSLRDDRRTIARRFPTPEHRSDPPGTSPPAPGGPFGRWPKIFSKEFSRRPAVQRDLRVRLGPSQSMRAGGGGLGSGWGGKRLGGPPPSRSPRLEVRDDFPRRPAE